MTFQESIGSLDPDLYSTSIHNMIMSAFHAFKSESGMNWRDMEVALYELHAFAEPLKGIPPPPRRGLLQVGLTYSERTVGEQPTSRTFL